MNASTPVQIEVRKPGYFKRRYEFYSNDKQVAVIQLKKGWRNQATFFIGEKQWDIRCLGFWKRSFELTAQQSPYTKQNIEYNWKYKMNFKDSSGNWYLFKKIGVWKARWCWIDEKGQPYIEMKSVHFSKKRRGEITLSRPATDDIYLLMLLGWFQLITYEAQVTVAAAAS